ncbi:hypothetical protein N825_29705 [Skermanella stibiiresistens SB22]|uniref:histidine kinase n=2 Tax=Skermanella TaxID=204447 RepID=W9GQX4_9PROT|nr:hypothetical protein N825_29705 [Skermanella stibiiresistens SB22]
MAAATRNATEIVGVDGTRRLFAYSPPAVPPNGLFVAVGLDKTSALAAIDRSTARVLGSIALGVALILIVTWLGGRWFLRRPIQELVDATGRWRSGDYAARVAGKGAPPEIATLARAFNAMADEVEDRARLREEVHRTAVRMAEVLRSTTDSVYEVDGDWRLTYMNQRASDLIADGRDLTGQILWDAFPEAIGTEIWESYRRAMAERAPVAFETFFPPHDRWYAVRLFPSAADGGQLRLASYFQDVTERRGMEERLREREARYRAIVETATDAMVVIDGQYHMLSFNPAAERIFGLPEGEAIGRGVTLLMPETAPASGGGWFDEVSTNRVPVIGREVEGRRRDGSVFPLELSVAAWTADGQTRFTCVMRDISRRRRAEAALAAAHGQAAEILESIGDGFYAIDADWRFTYANRRALDAWGKRRDEIFGQIAFEVFPHARDSDVYQVFRDAMAGGRVVEFEAISPIFKRWTSFSVYPRAEGGVSVYFRDISARRTAEEALRASEERHRTLVQALPQLVWTCGVDGACDFLSPQWLAHTGLSAEDQLGDGWLVAIHPEDRTRLMAEWRRSVESRVPFDCDARIRGADGNYRWFKQRALPVAGGDGVVRQWFGTSTDIADAIEARDASRAAKEAAERANKAQSRFLASASHDLRQPMQSLFLFVAALAPHVGDGQGREVLGHIERGLDVLKGLLDTLLDVSQLDAGVMSPSIEEFPVTPLLDHLSASYAAVARGKGLDWSVEPCPWTIRSDPVLLGRVLRNLVENAIRYTSRGAVSIGCRVVGDALRIEVRDTGAGIAEDQIERVWDEFHQVGNPERDRSKGLGLGLAIVRRIARLLDCAVDIVSRPGEGSTFGVVVPLGRAADAARPPPASWGAPHRPSNHGAGRCALVIDDDVIVLLGLQRMLADWDYEVVIAADAEQAITRLKAIGRDPDVILADYRLREGRVGTEAVARVRTACGRMIPGVILTGETGAECRHEVAAMGLALAFKPVTPQQLSMMLDSQTPVPVSRA